MTRKKKIIVLVVSLFVGLIVSALVLAVLFWAAMYYQFGLEKRARDYVPQFINSDLVLVNDGKEALVFYKTQDPYQVGDQVSSLDFVEVFRETPDIAGSDDPEFKLTFLQPHIIEVGYRYVVIKLPVMNFDCLGVYQNNRPFRYEFVEYGLLPTPSDAWMCKGYDFKKPLR